MRVFDSPNMAGFRCPICKTPADQPVTLVGIPGTGQGGVQQAVQIHVECYELFLKMCEIENKQS